MKIHDAIKSKSTSIIIENFLILNFAAFWNKLYFSIGINYLKLGEKYERIVVNTKMNDRHIKILPKYFDGIRIVESCWNIHSWMDFLLASMITDISFNVISWSLSNHVHFTYISSLVEIQNVSCVSSWN